MEECIRETELPIVFGALAPGLAADMHFRDEVIAFIGPACAFALEPVARLAAYWNTSSPEWETSANDPNKNTWQQDRIPKPEEVETKSPQTENIKKSNTSTYAIPTHNQFDILDDEEATTDNKETEKPPKPEPIFVTGVLDINALRNKLKEITTTDDYTMTTLKSGHIVKIMPANIEIYKSVRKNLSQTILVTTYMLKSERPYRVVLRGLHSSEDTTEIKRYSKKTGTKFTSKSFLSVKGYTTYNTNHPSGNAHGGTAVLIKCNIKHHSLEPFATDKIQATLIKVSGKSSDITIAAVYCPPKHQILREDYRHFFSQLGHRYIIGGDWNAKHLFWGSRLVTTRGRQLYQAVKELNLECLSTDLTSDHSAVILNVNDKIILNEAPPRLYNKKTNWEEYRDIITEETQLTVSLKTVEEVEQAIEDINKLIHSAANRSTPQGKAGRAKEHVYPTFIGTV
ncbi:RNA-directed DNA polymerase from mobile element jockey [Eumeta japonica]|uniref:RNA-directed DNA polymerase from mobile element jockey n=1 Tax=Eumeta variegata TaxID=151549 RepID=A0A4C2A9D4_EUMVA|nr:RNA-directed DNA polymerase from mobile element jockey [Eumeta japonica]